MSWWEITLILALVAAVCGFVALPMIGPDKVSSAARRLLEAARGMSGRRAPAKKKGKRNRDIGKLPQPPDKDRPENSKDAAAETLKRFLKR